MVLTKMNRIWFRWTRMAILLTFIFCSFPARPSSPLLQENIMIIKKGNQKEHRFNVKVVDNEYTKDVLNIYVYAPHFGKDGSSFSYAQVIFAKGNNTIIHIRPEYYKKDNYILVTFLVNRSAIRSVKFSLIYQSPSPIRGVGNHIDYYYYIDIPSYSNTPETPGSGK